MLENNTVPASDQVTEDEFDKAAEAGWHGFTRFLLINVIVCAAALLLLGAFTVWS